MRGAAILGRTLLAAAGLAGWAAWAGQWVPVLDALASLAPILGAAAVLGALLCWRRPVVAIAGLVVALTPAVLMIAPEWLRTIPAAAPGAPPVRIVTHNVWVENADPAETAQTIVDANADVVLLQEMNGRFRPMLAALRQHYAYGTDCPPGCGLAILSRWPIGDRDYFFRDPAGRRIGPALVWAQIRPAGMPPFTVASLHYPHPLPVAGQARRRTALAQAVARIDSRSLVIAGDMNLTPWAAAMRDQDRALAPMTRMTRALASWRRPLPMLPIDHLYAGPAWGLIGARRLAATGSDHFPLLITLGRR